VRQKRHAAEQMFDQLWEADALLVSGSMVADVCKRIGVTKSTYRSWRASYARLEPAALGCLRTLEKGNARPKKFVAGLSVEIGILKEVARGTF